MASGAGSNTIPGTGTFFVGIDIVPGRYRCDDGKGGWWVRFTGPDGDDPVGSWPLPAGPTEVEIEPTDFAFETRVGTYWRLVAPGHVAGQRRSGPEPRPVADPTLRAELDGIVAARRPPPWLIPLLVVALFAGGAAVLGPLWLLYTAPAGITGAVGARMVDDLVRARALSRRRDRYLVPEDLDDDGRALLARAQQALTAVQESQVNREGMLDPVDNAVTLPRQEWEIAQALARQSRLRRRQHELAESAGSIPEVAAAMRPLHHKLELSVRAVTRRVEALERYAERARAADEALRAHRQLEKLAEGAHEYDELLAETVRDDLALPVIERLAEQGEVLVHVLRARLAEAAEAGGELPVSPPGKGD
ncbi:hypothetical protein SAMN04489712_107273 [Thermomonospora echinospora]|uniref:Uncharacterized protein n=1 Tax=Thermomonospora echinospora TaxID=1992 RepID=A0A1H6BN90_9ACTN|nr:hypothetical protein [Thermomonospora echinospora]SEG62102.1 hypothetical protein SAMN04489712_107273 [Thermomonospora echinospora]